MVGLDANVLVYATAPIADVKVVRARDLIARGMAAGSSVLLLQTLAEFSNLTIRKAGIRVGDVRKILDAWIAVFPVQAADQSDLLEALEAVGAHRLAFWDAMLWGIGEACGRTIPAERRLSRRIHAAGRYIYQSISPTER